MKKTTMKKTTMKKKNITNQIIISRCDTCNNENTNIVHTHLLKKSGVIVGSRNYCINCIKKPIWRPMN